MSPCELNEVFNKVSKAQELALVIQRDIPNLELLGQQQRPDLLSTTFIHHKAQPKHSQATQQDSKSPITIKVYGILAPAAAKCCLLQTA
jgi:hypothetical protein